MIMGRIPRPGRSGGLLPQDHRMLQDQIPVTDFEHSTYHGRNLAPGFQHGDTFSCTA